MNKKTKVLILILGTPFVIGFLLGLLVGGSCSARRSGKPVPENPVEIPAEVPETPEIEDDADGTGVLQQREIIYYTKMIPYARTFADMNETHLEKARAIGLKHIPSKRDDIDTSRLERIEDDDFLIVDKLRYSVPYLTRGAAAELHRIARAFSDSLDAKQFPDYKLVVTSVLRTEEDVNRLRRSGNPNASDNSAHCYGTTYDITYTRYWRELETEEFMQPYELTKVLAEVLRDEKNAGRILVKYERQEHCFHITSCLTN